MKCKVLHDIAISEIRIVNPARETNCDFKRSQAASKRQG